MARKKKETEEEPVEVPQQNDEDSYGYEDYREDFTDKSFEEDDDEEEVSVGPTSYDQGYEF